jgi:hypothetical protein
VAARCGRVARAPREVAEPRGQLAGWRAQVASAFGRLL